MNILFLNEFIGKNGAKIRGDEPINQDDNMTSSKYTTDDRIQMVRQNGWNQYNNYGRVTYLGEDDELEGDEIKSKPKKKKNKIKKNVSLDEVSRHKMDSLIEDIFTKKDFDKEFVQKTKSDLRLNAIPEIDTIRDTNPILIRKVQNLKDLIEKGEATGEEKAIMLNYLLSMDVTDIPVEYKNELKKKIM
jgi:hypothetical protein